MENEILIKLNALLDREYGITNIESSELAERYDLDSLSIIELYLMIETEFNISIPDERRKMKITVDGLAELIKELSE